MKAKPTTLQNEINRSLYGVRTRGQKTNVTPEADIQAAVIAWLSTLPRTVVFRRNVGAMQYKKANGETGLVRFNEPGMSDVWGCVNGVHFECEVKRKGEEPRPDQASWLRFIRGTGGIAIWCDSLESCIEKVRTEFQARGWVWKKTWEVL